MALLVAAPLLLGAGPAQAATTGDTLAPSGAAATVVSRAGDAAKGVAGRGAAGKPLTPATLPAAAAGADQVSTTRSLERLSEFDQPSLAALKQQVAQRQVAAPIGSSQDEASTGPALAPALGAIPAAPTSDSAFEAFSYTGWTPSDSTLATGPNDVATAVNESLAVYNKSGTQLWSTTLASFFAPQLPNPSTGISVFDPHLIYDVVGGRFILVAAAVRNSDRLTRYMIAVSHTSSANGGWCVWGSNARLDGSTDTSNWADYPQVGVDKDAIILTSNQFTFAAKPAFQYAKVRFLPKTTFYDTNCPGYTYYDYWNLKNASGSTAFSMIPAYSYINNLGTTYLLNSTTSGSGSGLTLWAAGTVPGLTSAPTLTRQATLSTVNYTAPPQAVQKGSSTDIDTGDARVLDVMWRASGLWAAQGTGCTFSGDPTTRACLRWYEINPQTSTVLQQATWGLSGSYYYFPAIAADNATQDAVLVFNRSSSSEYASIRYTGRLGTDPANTLQGSAQLRAGQGCYVRLDSNNENRWGDYNGIGIDPATGHFWMMSQFAHGTSATCTTNDWRTEVGQVNF